MKQLLALMLAFCVIFTLTACQSAAPEVTEESSATAKTTVEAEADDTETDDTQEADTNDTSAQKTTKTRGTRPTSKTRKTSGTKAPTTTTTRTTATRKTVATVDKVYATDRVLKVACVGDSITAGGYWKSNLGGKLSTANYTVEGFGVSGSTALFDGVDYVNANTNAGKAYVDQPAYDQSLAYNADIVIIMLGTNDSKKVNWPYFGDYFIDDYIQIVESYQNSPSKPMVFIALPPTVYSIGKFQDISNVRIEQEIIPDLYEVASATGAIVIDTHTPTSGNSALMSDGVHPSSAGKAILCEAIAAAIKADTGRS